MFPKSILSKARKPVGLRSQTVSSEDQHGINSKMSPVDSPRQARGDYALSMHLAVLKEIGEIAANVPYIKGVAGVLLRIAEIRERSVIYDDSCDEIMEDLARAAEMVAHAFQWCTPGTDASPLEANILPIDLIDLLLSLEQELKKIKTYMMQLQSYNHSRMTRIRMTLSHASMLRQTQSCSRTLKAILEATKTAMIMHIGFHSGLKPASSQINQLGLRPNMSLPPLPQGFCGRSFEVKKIVSIITSSLPPANITILGPGGIGKTAVSLGVLHHADITKKFQEKIYFVSCDSCATINLLLAKLAQILDVVCENEQLLESHIFSYLNECSDCLVTLDNFETLWEQDALQRNITESFLKRMVQMPGVTLLVTMRGTERPSCVQWTEPVMPPLEPVSLQVSTQLFKTISGKWDKYADQLLRAIDGLPLAVTLIAYLAQSTSCYDLWCLWKKNQTSLLERTKTHRLTSVDVSIQLSLSGKTISQSQGSLRLLSMICMLPQGINMSKTAKLQKYFPDMSALDSLIIPLKLSGVVHLSQNFLSVHSLIRFYCQNYHPCTQKDKVALAGYYIDLMETSHRGQDRIFNDQVSELENIYVLFSDLLKEQPWPSLINAAMDFSFFACCVGSFSDQLLVLIEEHFQSLSHKEHVKLYITWGRCCSRTDQFVLGEEMFAKARDLAKSYDDHSAIGYAIVGLADIERSRENWKGAIELYYEALEMYKLAENRRGQASIYLSIGQVYFQENDNLTSKKYCYKALNMYQSMSDSEGQSSAWKALGDVYFTDIIKHKAYKCYQEALKLGKHNHNLYVQGRALENIGKIYFAQERFSKAEENLQAALSIQMMIKDNIGQGTTLDALGEIYMGKNKLEDAKYYFERALQCHKLRDNITSQAYSIQSLANVAACQGDNSNAIVLYQKAYEMHESVANLTGQGFDLERLATLHNSQGQYDVAQQYWQRSLKLFQSTKNMIAESHILYLLGTAFYNMMQYSEAREHWELSLQKSIEVEFSLCEGSVLECLAELDITFDNLASAIELYERAYQAFQRADYVLGQERTTASLAELQIMVQTYKRA
ncbi:TPR-like protein [Auriscalpium vulgare]|uniref:TPR-like protein n=1 Tax=Auriscalpium vulgare TaxID=40419 RepID=A0ACB8RFC0_9AGAM|nr:TPR-like protein [Auriscalpium vulgare]